MLLTMQIVRKNVSEKVIPFVTWCVFITPVRFDETKKQMSAESNEEQ